MSGRPADLSFRIGRAPKAPPSSPPAPAGEGARGAIPFLNGSDAPDETGQGGPPKSRIQEV